MDPCVENCREDLIESVNKRMTTKNFLTALAIVAMVLIGIGTVAYTAYSGGQKEVREAVKEQTATGMKTQQKVKEIEVNQRHMMDKQDDFKGQIRSMEQSQHLILQEIIKIRDHQVNGVE